MAKAAGIGDVTCPCGKTFTPKGRGRRPTYCSDRCRNKGRKDRPGGFRSPVVVLSRPQAAARTGQTARRRRNATAPATVHAAVLAELETVDRVGSSLGQSALFLARQIDEVATSAAVDSGASKAAMVRELGRVMDVATRVAEGAKGDELDGIRDEVAAQRARHS